MDIFTEFLAFDGELNEVAQALDDVVVHLLPPDQVLPQQGHAQALFSHLLYNSESEPDSDNDMNPDLPWREVQDIPSFQLMSVIRNHPQQPILTENNSPFSLQNATPPPNISDNHDKEGLHSDWVSCVPPGGPDLQ